MDKLDDIFLTKEQTKWLNKGKEQALRDLRMKNSLEKRGLRIDKLRASFLLEEKNKINNSLKKEMSYWMERANRFENKGLRILHKLKKKISTKFLASLFKIFTSSSREYSKAHI